MDPLIAHVREAAASAAEVMLHQVLDLEQVLGSPVNRVVLQERVLLIPDLGATRVVLFLACGPKVDADRFRCQVTAVHSKRF